MQLDRCTPAAGLRAFDPEITVKAGSLAAGVKPVSFSPAEHLRRNGTSTAEAEFHVATETVGFCASDQRDSAALPNWAAARSRKRVLLSSPAPPERTELIICC